MSVPKRRALIVLSQAQDVGLMWLSPQQASVVIQSFSPERPGSEDAWGRDRRWALGAGRS